MPAKKKQRLLEVGQLREFSEEGTYILIVSVDEGEYDKGECDTCRVLWIDSKRTSIQSTDFIAGVTKLIGT